MICLGLNDQEKQARIEQWLETRDIEKVVVIASKHAPLLIHHDRVQYVAYEETINYVVFCRPPTSEH